MIYVNKNKVMTEAYERYKNSTMYSLRDAYSRYSDDKLEAWYYYEDLCKEYRGTNLKIIGANTFKFSAGFEVNRDGKTYFCYITDVSIRCTLVS